MIYEERPIEDTALTQAYADQFNAWFAANSAWAKQYGELMTSAWEGLASNLEYLSQVLEEVPEDAEIPSAEDDWEYGEDVMHCPGDSGPLTL